MATLVRDPEPIEIQQLRERREELGIDQYDEVWEGVLHMNPPPSTEHQSLVQQLAEVLLPLARHAGLFPLIQVFGLGTGPKNYRVPDGGLFRDSPHGVWQATAALAIEVVSPDDETWNKFSFYAAHQVDELLILDPHERRVHWFALADGEYKPTERSALIELGVAELAEQITWPDPAV
jgi:Uma2 family endonuclease